MDALFKHGHCAAGSNWSAGIATLPPGFDQHYLTLPRAAVVVLVSQLVVSQFFPKTHTVTVEVQH
ncbi:hypothetical protein JOB18_020335 [Solea senegalensis]|uniref:Uncharacterized protein n=1 Tax=Solea senegalensis TaxID=28829 RepID=A0AAV6RLQ0_SOLSE|nr:hypothetical protein JOB18_020335 [Solea senegalensis]